MNGLHPLLKKSLIVIPIALLVIGLFTLNNKAGKLPDVTFNIIDGSRISSDSLYGNPLLINFWSTTCGICIQEMPEIIHLYNTYRIDGLEIIGVAMAYDPPNEVLEFVAKKDLPYPIALDIDNTVNDAFSGIDKTPTSFLISPDGMILKRYTGALPFEEIKTKIDDMVNKKLSSNTITKNLTRG